MVNFSFEDLYTKSSTKTATSTLGKTFDMYFRDEDENIILALKEEIDFFLRCDKSRTAVKDMNNRYDVKFITKDSLKKMVKRDIHYLQRLIFDQQNKHYLKKAQEVFVKHYGRYDKFDIEEISNYILDIKAHKTLPFDNTTKYHAYSKTSVSKSSLQSQMLSILEEYGIDNKIGVSNFLKEL